MDANLANSTPVIVAVKNTTRTTPTIFVQVADPIGSRLVESLARPGGNLTGFTNFEPSMAGKWLEFLRSISPRITRIAYLFNPKTAPPVFANSIENMAHVLPIKLVPLAVDGKDEMERVIEQLAAEDTGLLVLPDVFTTINRQSIIALAARLRLSSLYPFKFFAVEGGLMSYAADVPDTYRKAASYVDRILRGTNPADLPVQQPSTFEFVINLRTAKELGIVVPPVLLAIADEVIE